MAYDKVAYEKHKQKVLERQRIRRAERKRWLREEILAKSACKCGESHVACLDFHHVDPTKKEFGLGYMLQLNKNKEQILAEIAKCEILCANCHRKLHWEERNIGS